MQGKKLFTLLGTFDETEWRSCNKYLKFSSKKGARIITIFNYIYRNREILDIENPDMDRIHQRTCSEISRKTFLNRLSDLSKNIDSFLVYTQMRKEESSYDYNRRLAEIYKGKGLYTMFESSVNALLSELESDQSLDLFRAYRIHDLCHTYYFSDLYGKKSKDLKLLKNAMHRCSQYSQNLMSYYQTEEFSALRMRPSAIVSIDPEHDSLDEVLRHYDTLTKHRDHKSFEYLDELIMSSFDSMSKDLALAILVSLLNYLIYRTKLGDMEAVTDVARLNLFGLEKGLLLEFNKLSETRFLNIVDSLSKSNLEISEVHFIDRWAPFVQTKDGESLRNMAYAMWYFAKGEYGKTLQYLNYFPVDLTSLNYSLRSRWMQICSLCSLYPDYDLKDEALNSALAYFRRIREMIDIPTYEGSINLVRIVKQLWIGMPVDIIEKNLEGAEFLIFKYWIQKQIAIKKADLE